jgi:magnesium transporter
MIRSFVFSQGKLVSQDIGLDLMRSFLFDDDVQIWADLDQPTDAEIRSVLEGVFQFHALAIEDCMTLSEQPKIDEYENHLFLVIHAVDFSAESHEFRTTELNLFIGKNFLVTVHRTPLRSINSTVDRVTRNIGSVAKAPDRLSYTILDFLLDNYEPAINDLSNDIARLEHDVLSGKSINLLKDLQHLKSEVQRLRQISGPQREVLARLARGEFKVVRAHLLPYYRDLQDRLARFAERADSYRDAITGIMQTHLTLQQNDMNKVIKVLTIITVLSTPVQVITSFYGMNFVHMPELHVEYAHLYVLIITILMTWGIYWMLKKRKWL